MRCFFDRTLNRKYLRYYKALVPWKALDLMVFMHYFTRNSSIYSKIKWWGWLITSMRHVLLQRRLIIYLLCLDHPTKPEYFRPICLSKVSYKIISKLLMNKLRVVMDKMISLFKVHSWKVEQFMIIFFWLKRSSIILTERGTIIIWNLNSSWICKRLMIQLNAILFVTCYSDSNLVAVDIPYYVGHFHRSMRIATRRSSPPIPLYFVWWGSLDHYST